MKGVACTPRHFRHQYVLYPRIVGKSSVRSRAMVTPKDVEISATDMEERVRQLYDYDAIVARAPSPESYHWVFGYGSILFKQGFEATSSVSGYIKGWRRVFHQNSTDHRGTPEQPGRTVTLEPAEGCKCYGIAYRLPEDIEERRLALQELEWREKQYDERHEVDIYADDGSVVVSGALTYIGSADRSRNVNYGGPLSTRELAEQIINARGPSGPNREYLFGVAAGLRRIGAHDEHVFQLEEVVKSVLENNRRNV